VIAIIGILVGISMPVLSNFRGDNLAGGIRQMMGDVARARQLAISQRTTVYMVFMPTNYWRDPAFNGFPNPAYGNLSVAEKDQAAKFYDKQRVAYNFVSLRTVGDQPGPENHTPKYLSNWKTLPEGVIIPEFKFLRNANGTPVATTIYDPPGSTTVLTNVFGFDVTYDIPFPTEDTGRNAGTMPFVPLHYIAFDARGHLILRIAGQEQPAPGDVCIPLGRGSIAHARNADKIPQQGPIDYRENPAGNPTNAYTLIHIDRFTGRARVQQPEIR